MSDIFKQLEQSLPSDCLAAIESEEAEVVFKNNNFAILDKSDVSLFKILPLIMSKFGFCICIPYKNNTHYTTLGEILCRTKGRVLFKNSFKNDYRICNLVIEPWAAKK
jgi:hypothetical protein